MSHTHDVTPVPCTLEVYSVPGKTIIAVQIDTPEGKSFGDDTIVQMSDAIEGAIAAVLGGTLDRVGDDVKASLVRFRDHGIPTGGFLDAVLSNDLRAACVRADSGNVRAIPDIVAFVREQLPPAAWGSDRHVRSWLALGKKARDAAVRAFAAGCVVSGVALWHEPEYSPNPVEG